jgi:hypothetical protein
MLLSQMAGYNFPTLAMWPAPFYEKGAGHLMYELKLRDDGSLHWYTRFIIADNGGVRVDFYIDLNTATDYAMVNNQRLIENIETLSLTDLEKRSLVLKVEKNIMATSRRLNEEQLMLKEAIRKNVQCELPIYEELLVPDNNDNLKKSLVSVLNETPYIQLARLNKYGVTLGKRGLNEWVRIPHNKKTAKYYYRERIARGFGFCGSAHWGKTKSAIRTQLLPRANQLLQLSSVKRMLAEAQIKGQKALVSGNFVFWFESKGTVGWCIKELSDTDSSKSGNTLWGEGKILSKNHGRIVVLPYLKENGDYVLGHTKNAPNDGKALPRHQDDYVELPFEVLEDDLMIGLFGELNYE